MEHCRLIEALSATSAYPLAVETVEVLHTHISVVFLAGQFAYKIKKPVDLGFVDYSTLERRRHFCEDEIRLNRRLAPEIYLAVVPVTQEGGTIRMEGTGEVVEWAVKMRRLPDAATLRVHLDRDDLGAEALEELARRLARFHAAAESGANVRAGADFEAIARNARENFEQATPQVGVTLSNSTLDRLKLRTETALARLRGIIEDRAQRGIPRDTHGDLASIMSTGSRSALLPVIGSWSTASNSTSGFATPTPWPTSRSSPWNWLSKATAISPQLSVKPICLPRTTRVAARCCRSTWPTAPRCGARWKA